MGPKWGQVDPDGRQGVRSPVLGLRACRPNPGHGLFSFIFFNDIF